ncbi:Type IV secretory system Conjugative DNA transfer [Botrimarina colliarenosi]|uniref:Type IV secretory system Conjugative DNA transfer n=1 Tax=Botrimarina colliarenosi TaxID=2528001 RepID=A0A5C6AA47_9BACT|nr:type IV secretory system conjugative DNA transfer family protein [Botrimarina colliarenosi]TWT96902.1 Type IV secretory system Conjugative DNA transfer [Botrimarina colliarenosi]
MKKPQGHLHDTPLIGQTLPEHGLRGAAVHVPGHHYTTIACTGSGKLAASAAHQLIGWPDDLLAISEKNDLCDLALGRRCDPTLWDDLRLVRRWGRRLGADPRGITQARYHLAGGRVMNVDLGGSTAYPASRYTFLNEVDVTEAGAQARLMAIARGLFPEQKKTATADPYWQLAPQGAFAAVAGHVRTTEPDPRDQTLVRATERLMGIDPATGKSNPKLQERLFLEMMHNPHLGGFIAAQGAELYNLGEKTLGPLMSTIGTRTRWMLGDKRVREMLSGPSDFSLEELGAGGPPLSVFVTPVRGDKSSQAFLRMLLELSVLMFQQRREPPKKRVLLLADEVPAWGEEQVNLLRSSMNILRDRKVTVWLYAQSYGQLVQLCDEQGAAEILSASCVQLFGCRDKCTVDMIRDRLGKTVIRRNSGKGPAKFEEVYVADTDAIYDELSPASPLQYVFPYAGRPMRLGRVGYTSIRTREGLVLPGLNYQGHYDVRLRPYGP